MQPRLVAAGAVDSGEVDAGTVDAALLAAMAAPLGIAPERPPPCLRLRLLPGGAGAELHAEPSRCPKADPIGRGRAIVGGGALRNLELAVAGLGRVPVVRPLPDPDDPMHLATLTLGAANAPDEAYAPAVALNGDPWPVARWLVQAATGHAGVHAMRVEGDRLRTVGTVLAAALSHRRRGEAELEDVARWLRPGGRGSPRDDRAAIIERLGRGVLILVTTDADRPRDWLHAGRALQDAWLAARGAGLAASAVGGVLDAPGVRAALALRLRLAGAPQLLLHAGWPRTA